MKYNSSVDDYIAKSEDFAKPILNYLRATVHQACPEVEENMKWGMPFFDYRGEIMCHMAAFKKHCVFGFWKAKLMSKTGLADAHPEERAMGSLGKITALADLPLSESLFAYIFEAMELNEKGEKINVKKPEKSVELTLPTDLKEALGKNHLAIENFESKSASFRKEYINWVTEAKTEKTRNSRIEQAIEWIAAGKSRNWKYEKK